MIIKCTDGTEIDTDKLPDAEAAIKEEMVRLHELCTAYKVPYVFKYIVKPGQMSGSQSFVHSTMDVKEAGVEVCSMMIETLQRWHPDYDVQVTFHPKKP